jgi:hypothetical protein
MDDHGPHLSIGFAPFTPEQYEYPYLYAYAYPYPDDFEPPHLPTSASWHQEGWAEAVVEYEEIAGRDDHEGFVEGIALDLFSILADLL